MDRLNLGLRGGDFATPCRRRMGVEATKIRSELSRPDCTAYQKYDREYHFSAVHLRSIIGRPFKQKDIKSMAADLGTWTGVRCPRDWLRLEALTMCYLMQNRLILIEKWNAGEFTIQHEPGRVPLEQAKTAATFVRNAHEFIEVEVPISPSTSPDHTDDKGRIWWGDFSGP
jgi:hypothetical protein